MAAPAGNNPVVLAHNMANAEYNPAIASLKNLLSNLGNQDQYNQKQIGGWYTQMQNLMNSQSAQQGQATQSQIGDLANQFGNVAQLFGGNNAQQMQPALGNAAGMLGAVGASNEDYLHNMVPLLAAQAAQSTKNEQNTARSQTDNYTQQLIAQQHAKGNAYNVDYQQALDNRTTQQQNALALAQAKALMPYQVSAAKSTAAADAANAAAAPAYNAARVAAAQAQAAHYQAMTQKEQAAAQKDIATAKSSGTPISPGTASYGRISKLLADSLYNTAGGKGHHIITDATTASKALYHSAVEQGLINPKGEPLIKGAVKMLNSLLQGTYQRNPAWRAHFNMRVTKQGVIFIPKKS